MSSPTVSAPAVWTPDIQLFDAKLAKFQRTSAEIVVFCPPLRMAVAIPWPTVQNIKVPEKFLLPLLLKHRLHWACFCSLNLDNSDASLSCRIQHHLTEGTHAVCHFKPSRCSFYLNLTRLYNSSTFSEEYRDVEPLQPQSKHAALLRYLTCAHDELRVPGYWGEFNKGKQLGGVVIASDAPTETLQPGDVAAATSRVSEAVQADSPFFFLPPSDLNILTLPDAAHFISLAQGGGISSKALHTLLTQCPGCSKYFVGTFVEEHIESCGQ
ncbi:hypothetical protein C8J57DRAFT_1501275 [Mycena rebaudengoi]|nr:hypothetical protein C8J57DRAFT_1501275 [Mycena rebaudengoi]